MFAAAEIVGFVAATVVAISMWRTDQYRVLRFVVLGSYVALATAAMIGVVGIPLFLFRFGRAELGAQTASTITSIHHYLGHWFITAFVLFWPALFVASVARPTSPLRKVVMGVAALFCLVLFLFVSFTGYALPAGMPRQLTAHEGAHALRFVVLHVVVAPLLSATLLAAIAWRHLRAKRRPAA